MTTAYRGYLIVHNAIHGLWIVQRDGFTIGTCTSEAHARQVIDEIGE